jgi:DNA adenine methylase
MVKYYNDNECIKPLFSYPGNKSKLLKQIIKYVPKKFNTYYEPFLGSGAMFLAIQPEKALLNDICKDIINS